MSVDGTHFPIEEPQPYSTKWSSHKLGGKPGLNYEIGLSIFDSKLLWIHGPTPPPGRYNNITVFQSHLKEKIPNGRRVIADLGLCAFDPPWEGTASSEAISAKLHSTQQ